MSLDEQSEFAELFESRDALSGLSDGDSNVAYFAKSVFGPERDLQCMKQLLPALKPYVTKNSSRAVEHVEVFAGFFALTLFLDDYYSESRRSGLLEESTTIAIDLYVSDHRSEHAPFYASLITGGVTGKIPRVKLNAGRQKNRFLPEESSILASIAEPDPAVGEKDRNIVIKKALTESLWKACGLKAPAPIVENEKACLKFANRELLVGEYNTTFGDLGDQVYFMLIDKKTYSGWLDWSASFEAYAKELVDGLNEEIKIPVVFLHLNSERDPAFASRESSRRAYLFSILDALPATHIKTSA